MSYKQDITTRVWYLINNPLSILEGETPPGKFIYKFKYLMLMVTIVDVRSSKNKEGKEFNVLVLHGNLETVISKTTGRPYLTARKTSIPCTFDVAHAKNLIGTELPGEILKKEVKEYEFKIPGTDKKIKLSHSYQYNPEPVGMADEVVA